MKRIVILVFMAILPAILAADETREFEYRSKTKPSQRIELKGLSGSRLVFTSWDLNEVYVKISIRISSSDDEYEKEYVESFGIREYNSESELILEFQEPGRVRFGIWDLFKGGSYVRKELYGEVFLPKANSLTTDLSYGEITADDLAGEVNILGKHNLLVLKNCKNIRQVTNEYGQTRISGSGGSLNLSGTSSQISVTGFGGPAVIEAPYSTITATEIGKSVSVNSQSGAVIVSGIGGSASINAPYSNITASNVKGVLDVSTKSGSLRVKDVEGLAIEAPYSTIEAIGVTGTTGRDIIISGQSGSIHLENARGNLVLDCPYSPVHLLRIDGSVELSAKSADVEARDVSGNWNSRTEYSKVRLRELMSKDVGITNKSGTVDMELSVVPVSIKIRNEYAGVSVNLPKGFSGEIVLDAEYGRVETDFPIRNVRRGSSGYAVGTVGSGTGSITIETKSGDIELLQK